jgi:RNA polymerase II subunit A C-terminal domain phosphatase SSU72
MSVTENARIALICASNQNRSMETHDLLVKKGFRRVQSFGTNSQVKLPGTAADKPNAYAFSTTYKEIYEDLKKKDEDLYASHC